MNVTNSTISGNSSTSGIGKGAAETAATTAKVTIGDLVLMVNVALGQAQVAECGAGDRDQNNAITIDEILVAVNNALQGCG